MFIEIALRDLDAGVADPPPDRLRRAGARRSSCGSRGHRLARAAAPYAWPLALLGARQHGAAVLPDRVGPAVHRLGPRGDPQRRRAALHRALRARRSTSTQRVDRAAARGLRRSASAASSLARRLRAAAASGRSPARSRSSSPRPATRSAPSTRGRRLRGCPPPLVALGTLVWATLFALPLGVAQRRACPAGRRSPSVLALGVVATGVAYLLYFGADRRRRRLAGDPRHVPRARRWRSSTARSSSTSRSRRSRSPGSRSCSPESRSGRAPRYRASVNRYGPTAAPRSPPSGAPRTSSSRSRSTTSSRRR